MSAASGPTQHDWRDAPSFDEESSRERPLLSVVIPWFRHPPLADLMERIILPALSHGIEVIVVDDATPIDSRGDVPSLDLTAAYKYIRLQDQGGPGKARNVGLAYSTGRYIAFADADDQPYVQSIVQLACAAEASRADVAIGGYVVQHDSEGLHRTPHSPGRSMSSALLDQPAVWRYIFRRDFLADRGLEFPGFLYGEDLLFLLYVLQSNPSVITRDLLVYEYNDDRRPGRLTGRSIKTSEMLSVLEQLEGIRSRPLDSGGKRVVRSWETRVQTRMIRTDGIPAIAALNRRFGTRWLLKMSCGLGIVVWQRRGMTMSGGTKC